MLVEKFRSTSRAAAGCRFVAAIAILLLPAVTEAASITIDSPEMQAIFSQSSFAGTPISIRFNAPRLIVAPGLLDIQDVTDLSALYALAPDPAPTVDAFFVDQLNACGSSSRESTDCTPGVRSCRAIFLWKRRLRPNSHLPR